MIEEKKLKKYSEIALIVVREASKFLIANFGPTKNATHKTEHHFGIEDDIKLNDFYEKKLKRLTPEISLYTEEGEKNLDSDLVWVVDPIDGTSNYRVGNPFYGTQIFLLYRNDPLISIISAPSLKQTFRAIKGKGSFLNNNKIKVTPLVNLKESLVSIGKGTKYSDNLWYGGILKNMLEQVRTFRHFGSAGLELAYTASGKIDIYINKGAHFYDYTPGVLIVREAGGVVTDFNGNEWNINEDSLIASNRTLNEESVKIFKR